MTGNQTIDGSDLVDDDDDADPDIDGDDDDDDDDDFSDGATGVPGIATTSNNLLPNVTGPGRVRSKVAGSTVEVTNTTIPPTPLPANYPVSNSLSPASGALGLTNGNYDSYLNSLASTSVPCNHSCGYRRYQYGLPDRPPAGWVQLLGAELSSHQPASRDMSSTTPGTTRGTSIR